MPRVFQATWTMKLLFCAQTTYNLRQSTSKSNTFIPNKFLSPGLHKGHPPNHPVPGLYIQSTPAFCSLCALCFFLYLIHQEDQKLKNVPRKDRNGSLSSPSPSQNQGPAGHCQPCLLPGQQHSGVVGKKRQILHKSNSIQETGGGD